MLLASRYRARIWEDCGEGWLIITGAVLYKNLDRYFKEENKHELEQKAQ